eukprot:753523-Hanusia_phi.AAC.7
METERGGHNEDGRFEVNSSKQQDGDDPGGGEAIQPHDAPDGAERACDHLVATETGQVKEEVEKEN